MQCDSFNRNDMTCELQLSHNILAERHEKGADGGEGGSCSIGTYYPQRQGHFFHGSGKYYIISRGKVKTKALAAAVRNYPFITTPPA